MPSYVGMPFLPNPLPDEPEIVVNVEKSGLTQSRSQVH